MEVDNTMFTDISVGAGPGELCSFVASRLIEPHTWLEHTGFDRRGRTPRVHISCPSGHRASPAEDKHPRSVLKQLMVIGSVRVILYIRPRQLGGWPVVAGRL